MLKIKVEQPPRKYVSLDSLPIGTVFVRPDYRSDKIFMKTDTNDGSFSYSHGSAVCNAICLNDGAFYIMQNDIWVREVKAELTINDFLT